MSEIARRIAEAAPHEAHAPQRPRTRDELVRHSIRAQLHSISAACEAALASLAILDGAAAEPAQPRALGLGRPPRSEVEADFFGKVRRENAPSGEVPPEVPDES